MFTFKAFQFHILFLRVSIELYLIALFHHHHHMLDPILPRRRSFRDFVWSLSLLRIAILFDQCILFHQSIFLHLILHVLFPRLFRSSSTTTYFKFQSLHYHIFVFFPQNMTVPPYPACFLSLHYHIFVFFPQNMTVPPYPACFSHSI